MEVKKIINETVDIDIEGATLLTSEEVELLPRSLRRYGNWWWTKTKGGFLPYAVAVANDGTKTFLGVDVEVGSLVVRPALILKDLDNTVFNIGDKFVFDNKEFEIISESLAFCLSDIGYSCFNQTNSNIYEDSTVKNFVDDWFESVATEEQQETQEQ